ncbi:MAG: glycosyl transferase [Paenibacillus sp.]|nr:glycosyl transferase [Paenibacillus sp.]
MTDDRNRVELSIVIPAFNEEAQLPVTLQTVAYHAGIASSHYEIIVVDDGSRDGTWDVLQRCATTIKGLRALRLSRNFGKETALCAGLEVAAGAAVVVIDADLQHPPELIPVMVDMWRKDARADIVEGRKRWRGEESWSKRLGAKLFYGVMSRLLGHDFEGATDFKLLDRKVIDAWKRLPERTTFFRGMIAWVGFHTVAVEFDVHTRNEGKSRWNLVSLVKLAVNAIIAYSAIPLRVVGVIGFLFMIGAGALGIQALYKKIVGSAMTGFTTVILLLLIIGSIVMISLATIGEYVAAIYNEVKGRPRYLIRDQIGGEAEVRHGDKSMNPDEGLPV